MADIPATLPTEDKQLVRELLEQKPPEFTNLTLTQHEAFRDGVLDEGNHLVVAETGNGKTFIAEAVAKKALNEGENIAYLVPSKALVAEKHDTLTAWTDSSVTVNKGYGYTEADIIVATFESYFEAVIRGLTDRFENVILDDFHEIYSPLRGPDIEKGISAALDKDASVLAISATVGNPHTVCRWLDADLTISSEDRAVPIKEKPVEKTDEKYANQIANLIRSHRDKGPFLVFNETKPYTEARARGVSERVSFTVDEDIDFHADVKERVDTELTDSHRTLIRLLRNGIAYHHSDLESDLKDLVEEYTEQGIIQCVFCTTTLSYGFDSPVQSVITADLKRRSGFVGIYEYVQWIGRAGRSTELYDEAYAFPMYRDEDAIDRYQFETRVENKDIEDVNTHLSAQNALQWLVLELVAHGWETDKQVVEFIQSTLFWSEAVEQIPAHVKEEIPVQPGGDVIQEVEDTLSMLAGLGLIHSPIGQPQTDATRYNATEMGEAVVEYEHANWFDNNVRDVLGLADWLERNHDTLAPELLIERLAEEYYQCDIREFVDPSQGTVGQLAGKHGFDKTEGSTAALTCWFWCEGVPVPAIEEYFGGEVELGNLVSVVDKLETALNSLTHLYEPYEMPAEPEWLEKFTMQVAEGIPGADTYLVDTVDHFGRILYTRLTEKLEQTGRGTDWYPGEDSYLIEQLSALLADSDQNQFRAVVADADKIGDTISENILEAVEAWEPTEHNDVDVPFLESITERDDVLVQYHNTPTETTAPPSVDTDQQATTLNDF